MADEFELVPITPEDEFELVPAPRKELPSDFGKQFAAGVTDIATGLPALAGLVGAGGEALFDFAATEDLDFTDAFNKAASSGLDSHLLNASQSARKSVNEFLGVEEPISTSDQAARLFGSFIPIPGLQLASGASKLAKGASTALNVLTPTVKITREGGKLLNRGNALRVGAQVGIGAGIEQGVRAAIGEEQELPLLFSETARKGQLARGTEAQARQVLGSRAGAEFELVPIETEDTLVDPQVALSDPDIPNFDDLIDRDRKLQRAEDWNEVAIGVSILSAVVLGGAGLKWRSKVRQQAAKPSINAPLGQTANLTAVDRVVAKLNSAPTIAAKNQVLKDEAANVLELFSGEFVDATTYANRYLRLAGIEDPDVFQHIDAMINADSLGMAQEFIDSGIKGQKFVPKNGGTLRNVHRSIQALTPEEQQLAANGWAAMGQIPTRVRALAKDTINRSTEDLAVPGLKEAFDSPDVTTESIRTLLREHDSIVKAIRGSDRPPAPGLWENTFRGAEGQPRPIELDDLLTTVNQAEANPAIASIYKQYQGFMDDALDYAVHRDLLTDVEAGMWRNQATVFGRTAYVPEIDAIQSGNWFARQASAMGLGTTKGKELTGVRNWMMKGLTERGGVTNPINAIDAAAVYINNIVHHANISSVQRNVLFPQVGLQNVPFDPTDIKGMIKAAAEVDPTDKNAVRLVGIADPAHIKSGEGRTHIEWNSKDKIIKQEFNLDDPNPLISKENILHDDTIWVQHKGKEFGFYVPDGHLQIALTANPEMTRLLKFGSYWKRVFTAGTTGKASLFAPIAGIFAAQQASIVRAINTGGIRGVKEGLVDVNKAFALGTYEIFRTEWSRLIADHLTTGIRNQVGISGRFPSQAKILQDKLEKVFENSLLRGIRRESGRLASSVGSTEVKGNLTDIIGSVAPEISERWGVGYAQGLWRTWEIFNKAFHEGAATGLALKELRQLGKSADQFTPSEIRGAVFRAKEQTGDVLRRGASRTAERIQATIPFSGAMIQSWATIGRAMKNNPNRVLPMLAGLVGIPAATEMVYNQVLAMSDDTFWADPDPTSDKTWTYHDYMWNGYTERQRTENMILYIPGKPPWEAALIPVSPELALFRSIVMEGMDAIFNFSNVGNSGELDRNGAHFLAAMTRVMDIPIPPPLAAIFGGMGIDVRLGVQQEISPGEGKETSILTGRSLLGGERITSRAGKDKFVDGAHDQITSAVIHELFGSAGASYLATAEAFKAGTKESTLRGFGDAGAAISQQAKRQARWTQPLFGKVLRPTQDREISLEVISKKQGMNQITKDITVLMTGGMATLDGTPIRGNIIPPNDPVYSAITADATQVKLAIADLEKEIARHKRDLASLGSSTELLSEGGIPITFKERNDIMDSTVLQIDALRAQELRMIEHFEGIISEQLSERFQREVVVDFATAKPRTP